MRSKTLNIVSIPQSEAQGIEFFGDPNAWKLLCKASCDEEGWMKSTKAMEIPGVGCLVQVTTHQIGRDGVHAIAEAITAIPGVVIDSVVKNGEVVGHRLVSKEWAWDERRPKLPESELIATPEDVPLPTDDDGEKNDITRIHDLESDVGKTISFDLATEDVPQPADDKNEDPEVVGPGEVETADVGILNILGTDKADAEAAEKAEAEAKGKADKEATTKKTGKKKIQSRNK